MSQRRRLAPAKREDSADDEDLEDAAGELPGSPGSGRDRFPASPVRRGRGGRGRAGGRGRGRWGAAAASSPSDVSVSGICVGCV